MTRSVRPRLGAVLALSSALLLGGVVTASTPSAYAASSTSMTTSADSGWLRLAHLSPDTPAVDIYLSSFSGSGSPVVLRSIGYGDVSAYRSVPAGTYTATMRAAGAAASSPAVISATAKIAAGKAYTVAAVGRRADLSGRVLTDDLTPPEQGQGRIRLIEASTRAPAVDVQAAGGPLIASNTAFGTSTGYTPVEAGRWTITVTPRGGDAEPLTTTVDVPAGRVSSLLVLDGTAERSVKVIATVDSEGSSATPSGGVDTGFGPVDQSATAADQAPWAAAAAALVLAIGAVRVRRRRSTLVRISS